MTGGKPKLKKYYRDVIDAAREEAALFGAAISYDLTTLHPTITVTFGDQHRNVCFAGSPRVEGTQCRHMRQKIRRVGREMGATE